MTLQKNASYVVVTVLQLKWTQWKQLLVNSDDDNTSNKCWASDWLLRAVDVTVRRVTLRLKELQVAMHMH